LFAKALASAADAISIDLEDAVAEARKAEARAATNEFVRSTRSDKRIIVRVNGRATPHFADDVDAVAWPGLDWINLPKTESAEDVLLLAGRLGQRERERDIKQPIGILATIESPRGLRCAAEIAGADPRVVGLQLGFGDLFEPLGIERSDTSATRSIQLGVRLAAGEAGVWAVDSAYGDVGDPDGYRHEAEAARRLGYIGKSCIHPSQIALANEVFRPSDEEIARAVRVVEAWHQAQHAGIGALLVDGRMIDLPFARGAESVVALARRLGLV
jgi:citrate lyase subunit beta/citryl-CoA lyase